MVQAPLSGFGLLPGSWLPISLARMGRAKFRSAGLLVAIWFVVAPPAQAAAENDVVVGYIGPAQRQQTLSLVDRPPDDLGLAGAKLAIVDNNTTGRFTDQKFDLVNSVLASTATDEEITGAVDAVASRGAVAVILDLAAGPLLVAADAAAKHGLLALNVGATDDALRLSDCRTNLIQVVPSRAMLADALAQFLVWKKWQRWFLVVGSHPADTAFGDALQRAAARFGATIVETRVFKDTGGARTTDSGQVQVQRQLPVFMQGAPEHDVVVVADESEVFGTYMPFNTWDARPVVGTSGLVPVTWSPAHEQWGAIQLQDRFQDGYARPMRAEDMLAWMAVRMIGEAATRANSADAKAIADYMLGPDFKLAAFKGEALTIRPWNNQLRQPILLAAGNAVVSVSPQEGFLHPVSFLDTLGYDRPESQCSLR